MRDSLPKGFRPWLIAAVAVLVGSLGLLAGAVVAAFVHFPDGGTPVWVVGLGGVAVFGVVVGFGGLFGMMAVAGVKAFREGRKVQVLPPEG